MYLINVCYKKITTHDGEHDTTILVYKDFELSTKITDDVIEWRGVDAYVAPKYLTMYAIPDEIHEHFYNNVITRIVWEIQHGIIVPTSSRFKLPKCV